MYQVCNVGNLEKMTFLATRVEGKLGGHGIEANIGRSDRVDAKQTTGIDPDPDARGER